MIKLKTISIYLLLILIIVFPVCVWAQNNCPTGQICNPVVGSNDLMSLVVLILNNIIMPIGAVLCVVWIVFAGFKYVTAQGNPAAIKKAHETLLWALVGTGILLGAAGISKVIQLTITSVMNIQ